jgi:hypothetical protein
MFGLEQLSKGWSAAFTDASPRRKVPSQHTPAKATVAEPHPEPTSTGPTRILPSLLAEQTEQERIKQGIEAYKARWRKPKAGAEGTKGRMVLRRGRPRSEAATVIVPPVVPAVRPATVQELRPTRNPCRASAVAGAAPMKPRSRSAEGLRRGERWKRRLPKVCW